MTFSHACAAVLSSIAHPDLPTAYWQVLLRLAPAHVKVPWVSLKPRVRDVVRCVSLAATADARTAVSLPMVVAGWARIGWQVLLQSTGGYRRVVGSRWKRNLLDLLRLIAY